MNRVFSLVVGLFVLSAVFALVESLFAANPRQPHFRRKGLRTDITYWFLTPLVTKSISQIGLAVILIILYRRNIADIQQILIAPNTLLAGQPLGLQAIEMIVIGDFIAYWVHRWFHHSGMWKFHAVHHSSQDLDWLSAARVHPVNEWLSRWIQTTVLVVLGFSPMAVAAYLPFLTLYAIFIHANISWGFGRLGWLIASPKFHRWHHTSEDEGLDKNFSGLFPWIDILFNTCYMPKDRMPGRFGLKDDDVPQSYWGQTLYPFRKPAPRRTRNQDVLGGAINSTFGKYMR